MAVAAYGSWRSPITADLIVRDAAQLSQLRLDAGDIYWAELRPSEAGRIVVVRASAGRPPEDVTPPGYNARTRVHEYGGGAYTVDAGTVYFSNFTDQRIYRQEPGSTPARLRQTFPCGMPTG